MYNVVMGIITKIEAQKKNKNRVNLFIDYEFYCGLELITVLSNRLKVDAEITKEDLDKIIAESENSTAFEKAVFYTNIRMRSVYEMQKYLKDKGYTQDTIDHCIDKLTEYNYLDDYKFATIYINSHNTNWGINRIRYELKNMRVEPEALEQALSEFSEQAEDNNDKAYAVAKKYVAQKKLFDYNKVYAHLYSRGFVGDNIKDALSKIKQDIEQEQEAGESEQ